MAKRYKAELWDKTQYILSNFYDRMMHFAIYSDGDLGLDVMRKAIKKVIDNVYILRSRYSAFIFKHHWVLNEKYQEEQMCDKEEVDDLNKAVDEFLMGHIKHSSTLQFRAKILKCNNKCAFALLVNHQCFDGNDFKYVMFKIVECYNAIKQFGNADSVQIKNGSRALKQLYKNMAPQKAEKANKLYNNASRTGVKAHFRFTNDKNVQKRFIRSSIDIDLFNKLKQKGKEYGASINDVILAAYFRAYAKEAGFSNDELLNITSIIDLRRHLLPGKELAGCTNMVAFMPCKLQGIGDNYIETLKKVVEVNNGHKKDDVVGLYGIPLLALAYKIFWWDFVSEIAIRIGYDNPVMQMSNLGLIKNSQFTFDGCKPYDIFLTGAVKNRPYFQLTCVTIDTHMNFCVAEKCSDKEEEMIKSFLDDIIENLKGFVK